MKVFDMPRGSGKTTLLVRISDARRIPIVVPNLARKVQVEMVIRDVGARNASVIMLDQFQRGHFEEVLVDEALDFLRMMFSNSLIIATTFSSSDEPYSGMNAEELTREIPHYEPFGFGEFVDVRDIAERECNSFFYDNDSEEICNDINKLFG